MPKKVELTPIEERILGKLHRGKFMSPYETKTPKAAHALAAKGLVFEGARYPIIAAYFMPVGSHVVHAEMIAQRPGEFYHSDANSELALRERELADMQRGVTAWKKRIREIKKYLATMPHETAEHG